MNTTAPTTAKLSLAILSGVLLGLSFPPFETGALAVVAFVPFLILFGYLEEYREGFLYSYLMFLVFNVITLYWTGGFTHGKDIYLIAAGAMLLIVHPMFFCVPVLAWLTIRRHFGYKSALMAFPFLWVSFEYAHAHSEISFPWLTLGNTQTYDLAAIQFTSATGVYGLSFWILWLNVLLFVVYANIALKNWRIISLQTILSVLGIILLYFLPKAYGARTLQEPVVASGTTIRVGIVQPNIDPFEKWGQNSDPQISILQRLTRQLEQQHVDLVLWPETAVPFYILDPSNRIAYNQIKGHVDSSGVPLLTGMPDIVYYRVPDIIPKSSKAARNGQHYDTYNSSMLLSPGSDEIQKYAKMLLVPFAERVPFSEELSFLNAMQWNFGLGGWNFGKDATVFRLQTARLPEIRFSNMICYESVYPGFVADFVRKGAQFLTVITNDSWWGNTSGAYQHKQFAVLRAVENRRWIVQCANGGISCFIDPFGHILHSTDLYAQTIMAENIEPRRDLTFYSLHGDWLPEICVMCTSFFLVTALSKKVYLNIRVRQQHEVH